MSDSITDRIAAIVRAHQFRVNINGDPEQVFYCECQEGRAGEDHYMLQMIAMKHPAHVAEVIVEQLGLAQETRTNVMSSCGMTTDTRTGETTTHSDIRYDRRYTTPWEAE